MMQIEVEQTHQNLTQAERERATRYLAESEQRLLDAVRGFSEAQWKFKPAPDRWSAAEIL